MNDSIIIKAEGLSKKFCINQKKTMLYGGLDIVRSMIGMPKRRDTLRDHEIWALQDINFKVMRGDSLGIIGVNGAGKSTLLRVLSGIYPPDAGRVSVNGAIGALIAAGAGFHPDMTGRENIFLNGAIVGLKRKEIGEKLDEIIEFAEIGEFIDSPVRFYSSGMYVRLGFAIAVNIRPDILIIDEVLSVGDLTFQNKCFRKLAELRDSVDAVIFVSHNLDHIRNICNRLIVLDAGKIVYHGDVEEGMIQYQTRTDRVKQKSMQTELSRQSLRDAFSFDTPDVELRGIQVPGSSGNDSEIMSGEDLPVTFEFIVNKEISRPQFSVGIVDGKNTPVIWQMDHDNGMRFDKLVPGEYSLNVVFKNPSIVAGAYKMAFAIRDADSCEVLSKHKRLVSFSVRGKKISRAIVNCESVWNLTRKHQDNSSPEKHG
jgi:lipopolysaccharide transport system ATP-binding protein